MIDWTRNGRRIKEYISSSFRNADFQLKEGGTFSNLSSGSFSARYSQRGVAFESKGTMFFTENLRSVIGYMNTKLFNNLLSYVCPTLDYKFGTIQKLPYLQGNFKTDKMAVENISISRTDWDSFETSWDFRVHPLVKFRMAGAYSWGDAKPISRISSAFKAWELFTEGQFDKLKANEEELNRIFIEIYGLQDELTPEVEDKDVTIRKADLSRDIRSFISYAVGCMFGRYSLDEPGLQFAGGEFSEQWAVGSIT